MAARLARRTSRRPSARPSPAWLATTPSLLPRPAWSSRPGLRSKTWATIGAELAGLKEKLGTAIKAYAKEVAKADIVYNPAAFPYWFGDANANGKFDSGEKPYASWTPRLLMAAYNYQVASKDPGIYAHNPKYAVQILYDSLESLNGAGGLKVDMTGLVRPEVKK